MSETSQKKALASSAMVGSLTLISRIMGFVRMALIGALFGAGGAADVFAVVFSIPNNLRKLMAEGALSNAFIPELSRVGLEDSSGRRSHQLTREILGFQFLVIGGLVLFAEVFPEATLSLFQNFSDSKKVDLAVEMFRWVAPYLLLVSVSAIIMAVHNTHDRFFVPAITPILFSVAVIGTLLIGAESRGAVVIGVGVLIGGFAQIVFQWPTFRAMGYRLWPSFAFRDPSFSRVMKSWIPIVFTSSLFIINSWIANLLASGMADKSASSLLYAITLWQLPFGLFSASLSTILYPRMSREAAKDDIKALSLSLGFGYRTIWALLVPSAVVLSVLGEPIVAVAYQRGALELEDTLLIAKVLMAYAIGMPFVGLFNFSQRGFYSLGKTRQPFFFGLITVALDIVLSLVFVFVLQWDVSSLAWANTIAFFIGAIAMYFGLSRKTSFIIDRSTSRSFAKVLTASGLVASITALALRMAGDSWWSEGSSLKSFGILTIFGIVFVALILAIFYWMKIDLVSIIFKRTSADREA